MVRLLTYIISISIFNLQNMNDKCKTYKFYSKYFNII